MPLNKRPANVPAAAASVAHDLSKSDLLEALWDLAGLANEAGSVDDDASTLARLVEAVNVRRARQYSLTAKAAKMRRCAMCKDAGTISVGSFRDGVSKAPCPRCAPTCEDSTDALLRDHRAATVALLEAAAVIQRSAR